MVEIERFEPVMARLAWAVGIAVLGQAAVRLLVIALSLVVDVLGDGSNIRQLAIAGLSEAGIASGLSLFVSRPVVHVETLRGRWLLAGLMTGMSLPLVIASVVWSGVEVGSLLFVIPVLTVIGSWLAVEMLFASRLGIVDSWYDSLRRGVFLAVALTIWFVLALPTLSLEDPSIVAVAGTWAALLIGLALIAMRFYDAERDLPSTPAWSKMVVIVSLAGLFVSIVLLLTVWA